MTLFGAALLPEEVKLELCRELLAEFGADRIEVRRAAKELRVRCVHPDHEDSRASADLNYDKLVYSCFSCGVSGGLLWLIETCRGVGGRLAKDWLERRSGAGPDAELPALLQVIDALFAEKKSGRAPIPRYSPKSLAGWRYIHPYLTVVRGIPEQNVRDLEICYAERYPIREEDEEGNTVERYSERVVFPHWWTIKGERCLVGWQSRQLYDDGTPKYLSTAEFPRERTLYDYERCRRRGTVVVVESPMTVARHRHHLPITATFGASVTDAQVRALARHDRVILWMDNDLAGWRATDGWVDEASGERVPGLIERLRPFTDVWAVDSEWAADGAQMDEDFALDLIEGSVPGPVWQRPSRLLCWRCRLPHDGRCAPVLAKGA